MGSFRARYRKTLGLLNIKPSARDGFSSEQLSKAEKRLGIKVPSSLREYYLLCGKHKINQTHNRLLAPADLFVVGKRLVFMEENQNVVYWGVSCKSADGDPSVVQAIDLDDDVPWNNERTRCSTFLCVMLCIQASDDPFGPVGISKPVAADVIRRAAKHWTFIGRVSELSAYAVDGLALCVTSEGKMATIQVGGATEQDLLDFEARFGIGLDVV